MGQTKYKYDRDFFKKDTLESFYVAGFLAADGWLIQRQDKRCNSISYITGLSLKEEDKFHMEKMLNVLRSDHPLHKRIVRNSLRDPKYTDSVTYTVQIVSKELFEDLSRFNLHPKKSLVYELPEWIKTHKYVNHFLRGYFDGDGSLSFDTKYSNGQLRKTPQARLHLRGTRNFLHNFHSILFARCNLVTKNKIISNDNGIGSLQYTGNKNTQSILSFLYQNTSIHLDRKYQKYHVLTTQYCSGE